MEFNEKLQELRKHRNLTQEELADRCELSKGFISLLERDLTSPSITTLTDVLESLGSDLRSFFSEPGNEKLVFGEEDIFVKEDEDAQPLKEEDLLLPSDVKLVEDYKGNQLLLFSSPWAINWVEDRNKGLKLAEFGGAKF